MDVGDGDPRERVKTTRLSTALQQSDTCRQDHFRFVSLFYLTPSTNALTASLKASASSMNGTWLECSKICSFAPAIWLAIYSPASGGVNLLSRPKSTSVGICTSAKNGR